MSTPINITLDGMSTLDALQACTLTAGEGQYCFEMTLELAGESWFALADPEIDRAGLRVHVYIGAVDYPFLIEERSRTLTATGTVTRIWGRGPQALAGPGFAATLSNDGTRPWETEPMLASQIADAVKGDLPVTWNALDFAVRAGTLDVDNLTPIEIMAALAAVIGAQIEIDAPDGICVNTYQAAGTSATTYADLTDITAWAEQDVATDRFNAVTVLGQGAAAMSASLSFAEYDPDDAATQRRTWGLPDGNRYIVPPAADSIATRGAVDASRWHAAWKTFEPLMLKLYAWHPDDQTPQLYSSTGQYALSARHTETITEDVELIWGSGHTSRPDTTGNTQITGDATIPFAIDSTSYQTYFYVVSVTAAANGQHALFAYFDDRAAHAVHRFDVYDESGDAGIPGLPDAADGWQRQASARAEKASPEVVSAGDTVTYHYYGAHAPGFGTDYANAGVTAAGDPIELERTESVTFTNGAGQTSYPVTALQSCTWRAEGIDADPQWFATSTLLKVPRWENDNARYKMTAEVVYTTTAHPFTGSVPLDWVSEVFGAWFQPTDPSWAAIQVEYDVVVADDPEDANSVQITVLDADTDVPINGAGIIVNSLARGSTDADGRFTVQNLISDFSHHLRVTKNFYQQQDNRFTTADAELTVSLERYEMIGTGGDTDPRSVTLTIYDYQTDAVVDGAAVYVDGTHRGVTDAAGQITVTGLLVGSHTLKVTKTGYVDSDLDALANDSFTVS